jgi:hypothetical protein
MMHVAPMNAGGASTDQIQAWSVLAWCLPTLLGIAGFLVSFPIDRQIPFWPHLNFAEIFAAWFLFFTPVSTTVAIVKLTRSARGGLIHRTSKWLLLASISVSVLMNLLVLLGLFAATF